MTKFNTKKNVGPDTVNIAGGAAFSMSPDMELLHAVLTTFLKDEFYETGSDRMKRIRELIVKNEPQFVANLAVIARKEFHLRSVTHVLIGELSRIHRGDSLVKDAIVAATERPDDLTEIVAFLGGKLPKQVKRGIRNAILKFSPYQLAKYKAEGKGVSMVDLFNLVHPKVKHATVAQAKAWKELMEGKLKSFDTWENNISNAKDDASRKTEWEKLISEDKMGYMALLRNLNNLIKYGVSKETLATAAKKLADPEEVKRSKQLPFRFVTAYDNVSGSRILSDAISDAMEHALANVPSLLGKTLIAVDTSGSMDGDPIKKASIFAAALSRKNPDSELYLYSDGVKQLNSLSTRTPIIDIAKFIQSNAIGGGTNTGAVFAAASIKKERFDRIIILSDNESWEERWGGRSDGTRGQYNLYRHTTGADPYVYAIDIEGYGTSDVKGRKVYHLTGWSDRLLDFIGRVEEGQSLVEYVRNYKIK